MMHPSTGILLLVLSLVLVLPEKVATKRECHQNCTCKWRSGKQTAECSGGGLVALPAGLNPETQALYLTGNILRILPSKGFHFVGLVNLQKVFLSRCGLVKIAEDAFYHLANLVELDLSHNFLTWTPTLALQGCPQLRKLLLSHNPIQRLENSSFVFLSHLTTLELSGCQLESLDPSAFGGLKKLEFLKLDGNQLHSLHEDAVSSLPKLYSLDLHNNPWRCDCAVRAVRVWMIERNVPYSVPPRCERPLRVKDRGWNDLDLEDFACQPEASATASTVTVSISNNASLECRVHAAPEAAIHWVWRGRVITSLTPISFGRQMYVIREHGETPKISSLTIYNVMAKDGGSYLCVASNRAGNVSVNVTLIVVPITVNAGLSGGEIVGIVFGTLLLATFCFVGLCIVVLKRKTFVPGSDRLGSGTTDWKSLQMHMHRKTGNSDRKYDGIKENHFEVSTMEVANNQYHPRHLEDGVPDGPNDMRDLRLAENSGYGSDGSKSKPDAMKNTVVTFAEGPDGPLTRSAVYSDGTPEEEDIEPDYSNRRHNYSEPVKPNSILKSANSSSHHAGAQWNRHKDGTQTLGRRGNSESSHVFKYDHSSNYGAAVYGTWKRGNTNRNGGCHVTGNPLHLALSPEARDSPDEGLGDEREYETDIME